MKTTPHPVAWALRVSAVIEKTLINTSQKTLINTQYCISFDIFSRFVFSINIKTDSSISTDYMVLHAGGIRAHDQSLKPAELQ